jgi:hypothetical protein
MGMRHEISKGPDGFMKWLLTDEGRTWFETWPSLPLHPRWTGKETPQ